MNAREELKEVLKDATTRSVRIGETLHVLVGTALEVAGQMKRLQREARKAMLAGKDVEIDGVTTWLEDWEVQPPRFAPDGNRTAHVRKLVTRDADGNVTREDEKTFFRNPETAL